MSETTETLANKPVFKARMGSITGDVWANNSEKGKFYTVSIQRSYLDKEQNWQTSSSYRRNDLPKVVRVATKCYDYIHELEAADRAEQAAKKDS